MIGVSLLLWALAVDGGISRWDGLLLSGLLTAYTVLIIRQSRRETGRYVKSTGNRCWRRQTGIATGVYRSVGTGRLGRCWCWVLQWLVEAAVTVARQLGMSDLVVGLTIVAAGTSLPEVATSILAAIRGERDIAVGNIVGSNIFNILGVLGISASVAPAGLAVAPSLLAFDLPVMAAVAVACLPIFFTGHLIARWEGALFLAYYAAYSAYLILDASGHDAQVGFSMVMGGFVLPLTVITLIVLTWRHWRVAENGELHERRQPPMTAAPTYPVARRHSRSPVPAPWHGVLFAFHYRGISRPSGSPLWRFRLPSASTACQPRCWP